MFNFFKKRKDRIIEEMEKRGWTNLGNGNGFMSTLRPPAEYSMLTYQIGLSEVNGKVLVQVPRNTAYADRCIILALTDLVEAAGLNIEEYNLNEDL